MNVFDRSSARRPPDANHPYGHRKYETFAALGIVAMMLFGCREIISAALERLRHPRVPEVTGLGYALLAITIYVVDRFRHSRLGAAAIMTHLNPRLAVRFGEPPGFVQFARSRRTSASPRRS